MKITIRYDIGEGPTERVISPRAVVGWELAAKSKVSELSNGMAIGDLVTMLFEQMKADGDAPATRQDLLNDLLEIEPQIDKAGPTNPDEAASSGT